MGVMREVGAIRRDVRAYDEASEQAKEILKEAAEQVGLLEYPIAGGFSRIVYCPLRNEAVTLTLTPTYFSCSAGEG